MLPRGRGQAQTNHAVSCSSSGPSAPPYAAEHMPEFPDPVKPGKQQHHQSEPAYYQQAAPSDGYQVPSAEQARTTCLRGW